MLLGVVQGFRARKMHLFFERLESHIARTETYMAMFDMDAGFPPNQLPKNLTLTLILASTSMSTLTVLRCLMDQKGSSLSPSVSYFRTNPLMKLTHFIIISL